MTELKFEIDDILTERDPIFGKPIVINMDKDTQRWDDMVKHLAQWDIVPERMPAIHGIKLPCLSDEMKEHDVIVNLNLSHAAVSRHCLLEGKRRAWLVLEDDCRFLKNPKKVLYDVMCGLGGSKIDWSMISLGCFSYDNQAVRPPYEEGGYSLVQPHTWYPWGAHSYVVNSAHAIRLVSALSSCFFPSDHLLIHEYTDSKLGFLLRPSITYQEEYVSYRGSETANTKASADLPPHIIEEICKSGPVQKT